MRRVNMPYGIRGPILLVQVELWMLAAGSCFSLANLHSLSTGQQLVSFNFKKRS